MKHRKKILLTYGILVLVGIALIATLAVKGAGISNFIKNEKPENEAANENKEETSGKTGGNEEEDIFAKENERHQYFMDGTREKAEEKQKDYSDLLEKDPVPFSPKFPPEWKDAKTLIDEIPGFYDKTPAERAVYYKENPNLTPEEKKEFEKIKEMNNIMYQAYQKGDYNTFLKHMYKGWREFYGVFIGNIIKKGEYKERILGFYPDRMDEDIGYAYGFMVKEMSYVYNGEITETEIVDAWVAYKQNDKGEWEVYYEYLMPD